MVAALQWGLVQTFLLDTLGRLLRNYYRATTGNLLPPSWVTSIRFAAPLGLLVGGFGGYRWVTSGRAATSATAHRNRVVFVGALVAGWGLAIVPTVAFGWLLDDRLFTVPYFVIPTLAAVAAFGGAYLLAYRVEAAWYSRRRTRLLGAVQGAVGGLILGFLGFAAYGSYLAATRSNYGLDGGPGVSAAVVLGAVVGYLLADSDRDGDRAAEFLALLVLCLLGFTAAMTLGVVVLGAVGVSVFEFGAGVGLVVVPVVAALAVAGYLAYGARTTFFRRLVGRS